MQFEPQRAVEATSIVAAADDTVVEAILEQAARTPDAIAIVYGERHISYRSLVCRVDRWARGLERRGVGSEDVVAVALPRSEELVVAILATLRAGAAYLPLDPAQPQGRCRAIVSASRARALVSDCQPFACDATVVTPAALDNDEGRPAAISPPRARQLAYVIYTSGSTGRPKGVAIEHASLANHMRWMIDEFAAAGERVIQRTSCAFDASVWELFLSLMVGGTLVLVDDEASRDPVALGAVLRRETPSAIQCVPTFLRFALDHGMFDGAGVGIVFVGGEALSRELARDLRRASAATVVNLYGPTETTVDATWFRLGDLPDRDEWLPIGRPIANVWGEPIDAAYRVASEDEPGELWIGGAAVGRGYHHEPAMTARAFVPDPLAPTPGMRAYRTADIVRRRGGLLAFLGRSDRLVKLNGYRIELGEIEAVLRQHAHVRDAVVRAIEASGTRALVAYCLHSGGQTDTSAVRAFVTDRLPHYMMPAHVVWLDRFPVKPNGKLDYSALPLPKADVHADPPATDMERTLAEIWHGLFKRTVGATDNFFEIGGDSIRSIQVISLARARGLALTLQDIFECPTIRGLASRVRPVDGDAGSTNAFALVCEADRERLDHARLEDAYPTSVLLDALYFLNETSPRYEVYVTSCELSARWDAEAFRTAVGRIVDRHAWLRTAFAYDGFSRPLQLVHREVSIRWSFEDVRHLSPGAQDEHIDAWIEREKRAKFEWGTAPVWRIAVHHRAPDRFQLTLSEPMFDGWSVSSFFGELLTDYSALVHGLTPAPRAKPRGLYRDFVAAEQAALQSTACVEFWRQKLSGNFGRVVPRDRNRARGCGVRRLELRLAAASSDRLREAGRAVSAPLKSVLLAAHARVLATLTGRARVVSGVIMNGRAESPGAEQVLGLHINTVPLVLDLRARGTWFDLIRHVFAAEQEALPHRRYPLAAIQKLHGGRPLFDASFNFTHFHGLADAVRSSGVRILRYIAWDQTFFPLTAQFHVDVNDSTIGLGLDYDSEELTSSQVEEIAGLYRTALEQISCEPARSFKPALHRQSTAARPRGPVRVSREDVLENFWRVVRSQPDAVALSAGNRQLSYAALSRTASALAGELRAIGVADRSVLVCSDAQDEALVALLAVLEAGGVYVPVDPAFPANRIEQIARNAGAALCLCDSGVAPAMQAIGLTTLSVGEREFTPFASATPPAARASAAYRIYTSGSTGVPKGVEVGHEAVAHFLNAMRDVTGITRNDVVLGITTIAFDISLLEMLLPITTGARLVAISRDRCRDGERLAACLSQAEATLCQATPTTWRMLLEAGAALPAGLHAISGGEALPPDVAGWLLSRGARLTNAYGPTETTIWSATAAIRDARAIVLGDPLGETSLRVCDAFGDDCMPGVPGVIEIGGAGVAHGYVGDPALTASRFVPNAIGHGERCFLTGDWGRQGADRSLEFLGRLDEQVKVRGYRVELVEIENALRTCPGVRGAVVKLSDGEPAALIGYVTLDTEAAWDEDEAKGRLRAMLPAHMVPRRVIVLDSFPLTANQKIDRSKLPPPGAAPRSGRRIAALLAQVKAMGADDVKRALAAHA